MNVTELARKLRIPKQQLLEMLPAMGFDIGRRAIKIDKRIAKKIIENWSTLTADLKAKQESEKKEEEEKLATIEKKVIAIPPYIAVKDFAALAQLPVSKVLMELMKNGHLSSINEKIDYDTAAIISEDLGVEVTLDKKADEETEEIEQENINTNDQSSKNKIERPPIIVVLGHVDHGKTLLLDTIRKTKIAEQEAGGITQHIGAYQVTKKNRSLTFIDTPGHEAFSMMRSRGAKIADIAILIVAADDGPKPQTLESIKIIRSAGIPMVVAINKIDKPGANIEKVKQELSQNKVVSEDWGGDTIFVPISAKTGQGIDELLETLLLMADVHKENIVANPQNTAVGTIIESHIDKGEGSVATVLIQDGTLHKGDYVTIGNAHYGKIRAMKNFLNEMLEQATPSTPVKIIGLKALPTIGDILHISPDGAKSKTLKNYKLKTQATAALSQLPAETTKDDTTLYLNIILKSDVLGSLEAIISSLDKLQHPEVKLRIIKKGIGDITESDIMAGDGHTASILGFHVVATQAAKNLAQEKKVEINTYKIIYELIDEVKEKLQNLLKPETIKNPLGKLKVLAVFKKDKNSTVLGGKILEGKLVVKAKADIIKGERNAGQGSIIQLQMNKIDVDEVSAPDECGIKLAGSITVEQGDILEVYTEEIKEKKLEESS